MASWGDVNAALNKMVREGVIASFRTNRADKTSTGLHVDVVPGAGGDADSVRSKIMNVLVPLDDEVTVTIGAEQPTGA